MGRRYKGMEAHKSFVAGQYNIILWNKTSGWSFLLDRKTGWVKEFDSKASVEAYIAKAGY